MTEWRKSVEAEASRREIKMAKENMGSECVWIPFGPTFMRNIMELWNQKELATKMQSQRLQDLW